jgi:hypothetical protein
MKEFFSLFKLDPGLFDWGGDSEWWIKAETRGTGWSYRHSLCGGD